MRSANAQPFRALPWRAQALIAALSISATLVALAIDVPTGDNASPTELVLLGVLAVACLACSAFEVLAPGNYSLQPNLAFFFWGAIALPPWAVPILAFLCFAPALVLGRLPWYKLAFNTANYILAATAARAVASVESDLSVASGITLTGTVSVLAAAVTLVAVNYALLGVMISTGHDRRLWRSYRGLVSGIPLDLGLAMTGACLAALWAVQPALAVLAAAPMVLVYRALYVPLLEHRSRTDAKTGLYNAVHFGQEVDGAIAEARRAGAPLSLLMVDLDHLRAVNNRHGHLAGDRLIEAFADTLKSIAAGRGIPARFGGEEFCLLLPGTSSVAAHAIAEELRARAEEIDLEAIGGRLQMTVSAGVATFPEHGETPEALLASADEALYDAKAAGRNRVRTAMTSAARDALDLPAEAPARGQAARAASPWQPGERELREPELEMTAIAEQPIGAPEPPRAGRADRIPWLIAALVAGTLLGAAIAGFDDIRADPVLFGLLVASVVGLDLVRIDLFERGNVSPASVPTLVLAYRFGPAGPVAAEIAIALLRAVRREPILRWSFDFGALGMAGIVAALVFSAVAPSHGAAVLAVAALGGLAYYAVNIPMLCVVMGLSEGKRVLSIWRERFAWLWPHYVVFGALAGGIVLTEQAIGLYTLLVFGFPVISLLVAEKQYVERSRASVTELRRNHDELEHTNKRLRALLASHEELLRRMHRSYLSTITSLARTIEAKDPYTGGHTERVARVATLLAAELGMEGKELEAIEVGGIIHDIGKIGIPDSILLKPGRLSDAEFSEMRRHPEMSSYIVAELELPQTVKQMARSHHERYDGTGYPDGLAGTDIPLAARILTVADTLDAMTSDRPYRAALALADAVDEIERNAGRQFCPEVVAALRACLARDRTLGGQYVEGPAEATEPAVASEQDIRQAV